MKATFTKLSLAVTIILCFANTVKLTELNEDFIDGFEKGMMERNNQDLFYDADCDLVDSEYPKLKKVSEIMQGFNTFFTMTKVEDRVPVAKIFKTINYFIENMGVLINIFDSFEGSDYCAGMNFGVTGAYILTNIADSFKYVSDFQALETVNYDES